MLVKSDEVVEGIKIRSNLSLLIYFWKAKLHLSNLLKIKALSASSSLT